MSNAVKEHNARFQQEQEAERQRIETEDAELRREIMNSGKTPAPPTPAQAPVEVVEAPVQQPAPAEPELKTYEYQPVDDEGRPIGAKQVIKYTTERELVDKVAQNHMAATRHIRELNKRIRLGETETEQIPADAARLNSIEFNPRTLTAEERIACSQNIADPEKFQQASDLLVEATLGAKPADVRATLKKTQESIAVLRAKGEADLFRQETPGYHPCKENFQMMVDWMIKYDLEPVCSNFKLAYNRLKEVGLLLEAPTVREVIHAPAPAAAVETPVNTPQATDTTSRITSQEPSQQRRPAVPFSGLSNSNSAPPAVEPTQKTKYSKVEIEQMSADVYRSKLRDPEFVKAVNELYSPANG